MLLRACFRVFAFAGVGFSYAIFVSEYFDDVVLVEEHSVLAAIEHEVAFAMASRCALAGAFEFELLALAIGDCVVTEVE